MTAYVVAAVVLASFVGALVYIAFLLPAAQSAKLASILGAPRWRIHTSHAIGAPSAPALVVVDAMRGRGRGGREHLRVRVVGLDDGAVRAERVLYASPSVVSVHGSAGGVTWISGLEADGPVALRETDLETAVSSSALRRADASLADGPARVGPVGARGLAVLSRDGRWLAIDASGRAAPLDRPPSSEGDRDPGLLRPLQWSDRATFPEPGRSVRLTPGPERQRIEHAGAADGATPTREGPTFLAASLACVGGPDGPRALELAEPGSVLVRHHDRLGSAGRLKLSAVRLHDGAERWSLAVVEARVSSDAGDDLAAAYVVGSDLVLVVEQRAGETAVAHVVRIDTRRGTRRWARQL
ncbi:MAG: hypothetical protein IT379_29665 [Deltaproteobacteria bacterium]|nr:hypothetical protein [Deltaproteobacteria bacterium]